MQSTIQNPPDILQLFADEIVEGHREAYQALREVLLETTASRGRTTPTAEQPDAPDPAPQPAPGELTTAQRLALRLRAAIAMLRVRPPGEKQHTSPTPQRARRTQQDQPRDAQPDATDILVAAGTEGSRFGERIAPPRDSRLSTHDPASSAPRDSSLIARNLPASPRDSGLSTHDSASSAPTHAPAPSAPTAPARLTETEQYNYRAALFHNVPLSPELYYRLLDWHRYVKTTGTRHPINATLETLRRIKPAGCPDPEPPPS